MGVRHVLLCYPLNPTSSINQSKQLTPPHSGTLHSLTKSCGHKFSPLFCSTELPVSPRVGNQMVLTWHKV